MLREKYKFCLRVLNLTLNYFDLTIVSFPNHKALLILKKLKFKTWKFKAWYLLKPKSWWQFLFVISFDCSTNLILVYWNKKS